MQIAIAVVQFEIEPFAPEKNIARAERFIQDAVAQRAGIIVFPEDFVTGPLLGRRDLADRDQRHVARFQAMAAKHRIDIVPGSIIEEDSTGLYNTTYYIDHSGRILGRYRKVHLWQTERGCLRPGNQAVVCPARFGKIGLAICWDLAFPELFRAMMAQGAEVVLCPSYWCFEDAGPGLRHEPNSEILFVDALCACRAFEQEIILVFANAAGELRLGETRSRLIGHSQIAAPFKGPLHRCDHNRETMFVHTVDTKILAEAEIAYGIRRDRQSPL